VSAILMCVLDNFIVYDVQYDFMDVIVNLIDESENTYNHGQN